MRIYIIDDDHLSTFLTMNMLVLEDATHHISTFLSGYEALEALMSGSKADIPELMLVDLDMPVLNGWDFLDALAPITDRLLDKCSIYILTSSIDISDMKRSKGYPFVSGLIQKPISSEDIHFIVL